MNEWTIVAFCLGIALGIVLDRGLQALGERDFKATNAHRYRVVQVLGRFCLERREGREWCRLIDAFGQRCWKAPFLMTIWETHVIWFDTLEQAQEAMIAEAGHEIASVPLVVSEV